MDLSNIMQSVKVVNSSISIDGILVILFLITNLVVGVFSSRGVTTIKEYAVGDKKFSTASLVATVVATCIGGGFFASALTETYRQGLYFILPALGEPIALMIVGYFLVPRMVEFLNTLSIAEAMGNLYGKYVRLITAFCGICLCVGMVALEFKVASSVLEIFLGINGFYAGLTSAFIVTIYSTMGGIRSVTVTDFLQFFTFAAIIPIMSLIIWGTFDSPDKVFDMLNSNSLFDFNRVLDSNNEQFLGAALLFGMYLFPEFQPVFFQRVVMASSAIQARRAFIIAGIVVIALYILTVWVSILMLADSPGLDPDTLLPHMIQKYSYVGFRGLTAIGALAIVMSTADSYMNSAAVLFSHDFYSVLKPSSKEFVERHGLLITKISAVVSGVVAFILAFTTSSILELIILVLAFYSPIVSIPLLFSLFGFRTTPKSALLGMFAGGLTVAYLKLSGSDIQPIVPGIIMNITFMLGSHYLLRQEGGWVGLKDDSALKMIRTERRQNIHKIYEAITNFSLLGFLRNNLPKSDISYLLIGVFGLISVFSSIYSLDHEIRHHYDQAIGFIYHSVIIGSAILITYPVWPPLLKRSNLIAPIWNLFLPYTLVVVPMLLVIVSNFGQLQLMILMINLIMIATILRWYVALSVMIISMIASMFYYEHYMDAYEIHLGINPINTEFKVAYALLLFSSVLIAFIKPNQDEKQLAENKAADLWSKLSSMDEELRKASFIKTEFLNNINHEVRTPMTGITSLGQALWENYDALPEEKRRECVKTIAKSSDRLISLMNNILDLSSLTSLKIPLNLKRVNLSEIVKASIEKCKALYMEDKSLDFQCELSIEDVFCQCDEYHIGQTIDNLIINAISYSDPGTTIHISLSSGLEGATFSILDYGIGIPSSELYDVFKPFTVSSNTRSLAGGRGVGLALCYAAIESHGGKIWAESDGKSWTRFSFILR